MSRLGINTGSTANDGTGDSLRSAMGKVNSNFLEIYNSFGNGSNLISYASTAGISTLAKNLTGNPIISVSGIINSGISSLETVQTTNLTVAGVVTAIQFKGDGSQLTNVTASNPGVEVYDENIYRGVAKGLNFGQNIIAGTIDGNGRVTISVASTIIASGVALTSVYASTAGIASYAQYSNISGVSTYALTSGISTHSSTSGVSSYSSISGLSTRSTTSGFASTAGIATVAGYASTAGIATVAQGLTGIPNLNVGVVTATSYRGSGSSLTGVITSLVAGANITITQTSGIATISAAGTGGGGSGDYATIAGYSTSSGIATVAQGLTGTPNISVNQVAISSSVTVNGITSFYNDVHFEYDKVLSIGNNDELQLFHNGSNSYIDNASTNNLIIRTHGGSIQLHKEGPELMGIFNTDGSVELYYDNVKKFETLGTGVTVSGAVFAQQLIGDALYTNQIVTVGVTTSTSFKTNSTAGNGSDVGFAIKYYITSNGSSGYRFAGPGIVNTIDNPTIYLHRGFTYIFENSTGVNHPFAIRYSSGGTGYGSTYLSGSQSGTQVFTIPFDAPSSLVYQCTIHSGMVGTFTIVQ